METYKKGDLVHYHRAVDSFRPDTIPCEITKINPKTFTKSEVESILFAFAESNGLTSTKGEVDAFNKWVADYFGD